MSIKKRVLSIDFDGCLFNKDYVLAKDKKVIEHNHAFLDKIKDENKNEDSSQFYDKVVCIIGSNRQSKEIDDNNHYAFVMGHGLIDKGSCFPAITEVSEYLGTTFDPMLLADIFADLPDGEAYRRATTPDYKGEHPQTYFDASKVALLYAQIHKAAMDDPTAEIIFDFYDDRTDILHGLIQFFKKYPELMPQNVTLGLNLYDGEEDSALMEEINGTGFIDSHYRQTVKDMIHYCFEKAKKKPEYRDEVRVVSISFHGPASLPEDATISPAVLKNRKALDTSFPALDAQQSADTPSLVHEAASGVPVQQAVFTSDRINPFFATSVLMISLGESVTTDPGSTMGELVSTSSEVLQTTTDSVQSTMSAS
jgi:hypothetical protein